MGDLTDNFSRSEFECKCGCGFDTVDYQLLVALQGLANYYKTKGRVSVVINCGCRCKKHNDKLRKDWNDSGGKKGENTAVNSQHIYGRAADIVVRVNGEQVSPLDVYDWFRKHYPVFSLGKYRTFTHVDCRTGSRATW